MTDEETTTAATPSRETVRAELESTRSAYHELLSSISADEWNGKGANAPWSVRQLMWHLCRGMEFFSEAIGYCRKGKAPNPPAFLVDRVNVILTKFGARGATPESVSAKYDAAHAALLKVLDGVKDDEWQKGATVFASPYTVESAFRGAKGHFEEHRGDVLKGLGRA